MRYDVVILGSESESDNGGPLFYASLTFLDALNLVAFVGITRFCEIRIAI